MSTSFRAILSLVAAASFASVALAQGSTSANVGPPTRAGQATGNQDQGTAGQEPIGAVCKLLQATTKVYSGSKDLSPAATLPLKAPLPLLERKNFRLQILYDGKPWWIDPGGAIWVKWSKMSGTAVMSFGARTFTDSEEACEALLH